MLIMFVQKIGDRPTIQWAGNSCFLSGDFKRNNKKHLLPDFCFLLFLWVKGLNLTTSSGQRHYEVGFESNREKLVLQTLIIFTGYIVSACTSQKPYIFGSMRSTWLKIKKKMF